MSMHWNPRSGGWPSDRGRLPRRRKRYLRFRAGAGEIRLMTLGGIFLGLVLAWGPSWPEGLGASRSPAERGSALAARVIDGDTFDHGGVRVRVADIDTPEVRGACAYERELAARATARMRTLLHAGPFELHRTPDGRDEDRYGRKLRIVTRDGRSLGDQLVAEGLARTWSGRREPWC